MSSSASESDQPVAGHTILGTPKSHVPRSVAFPHFLAESLRVECATERPEDLVFGSGVDRAATPTRKDGWSAGARKRCVHAERTFPARLALHDLRHTAAMTLDTSADLFEDDPHAVADALDHAGTAAVAVRTQT